MLQLACKCTWRCCLQHGWQMFTLPQAQAALARVTSSPVRGQAVRLLGGSSLSLLHGVRMLQVHQPAAPWAGRLERTLSNQCRLDWVWSWVWSTATVINAHAPKGCMRAPD